MAVKVLKETTVLIIPEDRAAELRELVKADGMFEAIKSDSGVSKTTLRRVVKTGKGKLGTITKILDSVKKIKKETKEIFS